MGDDAKMSSTVSVQADCLSDVGISAEMTLKSLLSFSSFRKRTNLKLWKKRSKGNVEIKSSANHERKYLEPMERQSMTTVPLAATKPVRKFNMMSTTNMASISRSTTSYICTVVV